MELTARIRADIGGLDSMLNRMEDSKEEGDWRGYTGYNDLKSTMCREYWSHRHAFPHSCIRKDDVRIRESRVHLLEGHPLFFSPHEHHLMSVMFAELDKEAILKESAQYTHDICCFMAALREEYDVIIIDTPSIMNVFLTLIMKLSDEIVVPIRQPHISGVVAAPAKLCHFLRIFKIVVSDSIERFSYIRDESPKIRTFVMIRIIG